MGMEALPAPEPRKRQPKSYVARIRQARERLMTRDAAGMIQQGKDWIENGPRATVNKAKSLERRKFSALAKSLAAASGDEIRARSPELVPLLLDAIKVGLVAVDSTAIRASMEILKLADKETHVIHEFVKSIGAKDEDELRVAFSAYQSADDTDLDSTILKLAHGLASLLPLREERRAEIVKILGGVVPLPDAERVA